MPTTKVFDENDSEVEPGSGGIGLVATSAMVPIGYYKDEEKSRKTFRTIDGVRWSFPGDLAIVDADGTIHLLGRSSQCVNTAARRCTPRKSRRPSRSTRRSSTASCSASTTSGSASAWRRSPRSRPDRTPRLTRSSRDYESGWRPTSCRATSSS